MQSRYTRAGIAWILLAILMCTPVSIFAQAQQQQQQPGNHSYQIGCGIEHSTVYDKHPVRPRPAGQAAARRVVQIKSAH